MDGKQRTLTVISLDPKPHQTLQAKDRLALAEYFRLHEKKKRTEDDEEDFKDLERKMIGKASLESAMFPMAFVEDDFKATVERMHSELVEQFGNDTPQKKMLIQRLCAAWGHSWSYERMFKIMKYQESENGGYTCNAQKDRTRYIAEVRRGMESVNDQIIRLTQALQNITAPPIQVIAKNAFFAQNQQINQTDPPKDFDKDSSDSVTIDHHEKAPA